MKKISLFIIFFSLLFSSFSTNAFFYSDDLGDKFQSFIDSASAEDLEKFENTRIKKCETIYLKATRRRDYTRTEILVCSDIFMKKREEELYYKFYMLGNRGIY